MEVCIYAFRACTLERPHSHRLVFPFFMFIMGVSMFFSLRKYNFKLSKESVTKVLRRTVLIFLVGLGLNLFGHVCYNGFTDFQNLRILGVMQRLALAYGFGSLIGLAINHKYILQVAAGILIFYWALLGFTHSMEMSEDSIIAIVDRTYSVHRICITMIWQMVHGSPLIRKGS